jgi:lambda repressor-like predicted transcriptional regulator
MTRERKKAVMAYKAAVAVFRKWFSGGLISKPDYNRIERIIAEKYGLSSRSIWREPS